jgi:hypothetical protein
MMRFARPAHPPEFDDAVKDCRDEITRKLGVGEAIVKADFENIWGRFKKILSSAQHGRCGYCDALVTHTGYGDVEHFRPKSRVEEINDPRAVEACAIGQPPKVTMRWPTGYAALAYDWNNYLFACELCNQRFKRCIFPLLSGGNSAPTDDHGETPLLLQCYGPDDPADHLEFQKNGFVKPANGSRHGYETIVTVGLGRQDLTLARSDRTERTFYFLQRLRDSIAAGDDGTEELRALQSEGALERPFGGVARTIIKQELGLTWPELEALAQ